MIYAVMLAALLALAGCTMPNQPAIRAGADVRSGGWIGRRRRGRWWRWRYGYVGAACEAAHSSPAFGLSYDQKFHVGPLPPHHPSQGDPVRLTGLELGPRDQQISCRVGVV